MDRQALCWGSWWLFERIGNIKPLIHEKQLEILLFLEISWFASFLMLEGEWYRPHPTRSTPGGVHSTRGTRGAGLQQGGNATGETGDDRANLEGSQCAAT